VADVLDNREFDTAKLKRWNQQDRLDWDGAQKQPEFRLGQLGARLLYLPEDPRRRDFERPRPRITDADRLAAARDVVVRLPGRVVGFAGDLTRADADELVRDLLPPVLDQAPDGLARALGPMTAMDALPRRQVETMPRIQQTFFAYGRHSLTYDAPDYPAFLVADHVLAGHFFSRMYRALRHEGGETYGAATTGHGGPYAEGYALWTFTRGDNAAVTEDKLREIVRQLCLGGITEDERQAAVGHMLGQRAFSRQAPSQILDRRLWERRHGLPAGFYDALVDRAAALPLDEINAFVREFYDPTRFTMLVVSPE
jgi:zinc protease